MRRVIIGCFFLFFLFPNAGFLQAGQNQDDVLATLNGKAYTVKDFERWWKYWQEGESRFPETPDSFINWFLVVQEAKAMQLYNEPSYRQKVDTFRKARSLMLLRYEVVDSKLKITDKEIKALYRKKYIPLWHVQIISFKDKDAAQKAYEEVRADRTKFASFKDKPVRFFDRSLRPVSLGKNKKLLQTLETMKPGEVAAPFQNNKAFLLVHLVGVSGESPEDFESQKKAISNELWDRKHNQLTYDYLQALKKKYAVSVNKALLAKINAETTSDKLLNAPLITTNKGDFPAKMVVMRLRQDKRVRTRRPLDEKGMERLKKGLVESIVTQALVSWESLDRHYEKKPPFQWEYQFYQQNRLYRELERRIRSTLPEVTEAAMKRYYLEHLKEFTPAEKVSLVFVETDAQTAKKIWLATIQGDDLVKAAREYGLHDVVEQTFPVNHLQKSVRSELDKLAKGEVSAPFSLSADGKMGIIKLVNRTSPQPAPFEHVKKDIAAELKKQEFDQAWKSYLDKLRSRSAIKINKKAWKALKNEFKSTMEKSG